MQNYQMTDLLHIMQRLRCECPWDRAQTPQSLSRYAIEEAYEVEEAIRLGDQAAIAEELGDLLLQVVFQAQMFSENGNSIQNKNSNQTQQQYIANANATGFDFGDVVDGLCHKLIRRHPHVFAISGSLDDSLTRSLGNSQLKATTQAEVSQIWQQVKQQEREAKAAQLAHSTKSTNPNNLNVVAITRRRLDQVKPGSALMQAQDLQKQAAKLGFDWPDLQGAQEKLTEEIAELDQAITSQNSADIEDELGDCFFALINVARKLNMHSEQALLGTVAKFRRRFAYIEDQLAAQGTSPEQSNLEQMDILWEQAKTKA